MKASAKVGPRVNNRLYGSFMHPDFYLQADSNLNNIKVRTGNGHLHIALQGCLEMNFITCSTVRNAYYQTLKHLMSV